MGNRLNDDAGFSLVETVVAMMVFAVVAVVAATMLVSTLSVTDSNRQRVAAANIAAKYVEEARGMRALDIPDGGTTYPAVTIQGTAYTAQRTANYVASGSQSSLCAGGGSDLVYKLVTVTVTWPGMGSVQPVRSDTLKALGLGEDGLNQTRGVAAVELLRADGTPLAGVSVTLSPGGVVRQTGVDGCALFTNLDPATTYAAAVDQPGHTGPYGDQALPTGGQGLPLQGITVTAGQVTRRSISYDLAGKLAVTFTSPPGYAPPSGVGVTLSSTLWSEGRLSHPDCALVTTSPKGCVSGSPRTAARLFPGLYGAWAGACAPAPASVATTRVKSAETASTTVPLAPLGVDLRRADGTPAAGTTLYLIAKTGTPCADSYALVSDASGSVQTSLPSGVWMLSLTAGGVNPPPGGWQEVTLDAYGSVVPRQTVIVP